MLLLMVAPLIEALRYRSVCRKCERGSASARLWVSCDVVRRQITLFERSFDDGMEVGLQAPEPW